MNLLDFSANLAFRVLLSRTGISNKDAAKKICLSDTGISKIINFRRGLSFSEVYLFCEKSGIDISEMMKLIKKFSEDEKTLKQIKKIQSLQKSETQRKREILSLVTEPT